MQLFDYQKKAVEFLKEKKKAYLALDMGMGKTITSLSSAFEVGEKNILLIAEKTEIENSQNFNKEVEHFEGIEYINLRKKEISTDGNRYVCGINAESLKKIDFKELRDNFDTMVIDEATLAKTTSTDRFKIVKKVADTMEHLYLLSGTPMMNGASELYAPLVLMQHPMVHKKGVKAKKAFEEVFCEISFVRNPFAKKEWLRYVRVAKGAKNIRELRYLLKDYFYILQKSETDIFKKKARRVRYVSMGVKWLVDYTQAWEKYLDEARKRDVDMENIAELKNLISNGQLYQVNSKWKAKQVVKDIANGDYGSKKLVVFSFFVETHELLQQYLEEKGISYKTFNDVKEWKVDDTQVLLGTIKSNSKGANLPEASTEIFIDMDFVPTNNIQAENRIDRPEQKEDMDIVYYITEGDDVIDRHVRDINRSKIKTINEFMRPLTEEEITEMPDRISALKAKFPKEAEILGI